MRPSFIRACVSLREITQGFKCSHPCNDAGVLKILVSHYYRSYSWGQNLQSSHPWARVMTNLVYMRMATHIVATVRHIILQARFAADCDCGSTKFGSTPGGGFKPGPWRSCSSVAIDACSRWIHVGRRTGRKNEGKELEEATRRQRGPVGERLKRSSLPNLRKLKSRDQVPYDGFIFAAQSNTGVSIENNIDN